MISWLSLLIFRKDFDFSGLVAVARQMRENVGPKSSNSHQNRNFAAKSIDRDWYFTPANNYTGFKRKGEEMDEKTFEEITKLIAF